MMGNKEKDIFNLIIGKFYLKILILRLIEQIVFGNNHCLALVWSCQCILTRNKQVCEGLTNCNLGSEVYGWGIIYYIIKYLFRR